MTTINRVSISRATACEIGVAAMNQNALQHHFTADELRARVHARNGELDHATIEEPESSAHGARCHELCRVAKDAWKKSGDAQDLKIWREAEGEWVRARELHSNIHVRKTNLKIQLQAAHLQLQRIEDDAQEV